VAMLLASTKIQCSTLPKCYYPHFVLVFIARQVMAVLCLADHLMWCQLIKVGWLRVHCPVNGTVFWDVMLCSPVDS